MPPPTKDRPGLSSPIDLTQVPSTSRSVKMPTRQRQPLYQLYLSLVATAYTFCNPPRRLEEHLRSLEGLDNLVLFYSVLGCYTFSVFLLLYWGVFSLATPFVVRFFHALVWAFGALGKGLPFLKVRLSQRSFPAYMRG